MTVQTPSRRTVVAASLLSILLITFVLGVSQAAVTAPDATPNEGTLVVALAAEPVTLDPALATDSAAFQVTSQVYDTIVAADREQGFVPAPGLATSWQLGDDGLTWTFTIRDNVQFHDGSAVDATAIADNLLRCWDPAHPQYTADCLYFKAMFVGPKDDPNSKITGIQAVDPSMLLITLSEPDSTLLAQLAHPALAIASPAAIAAGTLGNQPVGSGPFSFVEWLPGDSVKLAATTYWAGTPDFQSLEFKVIADPQARLAALRVGQVQVADNMEGQMEEVLRSGNLRVRWHPANNSGYLGMNRSYEPLSNVLVRRAIAHAINRRAIVNTRYTAGDQLAQDLVPPDLWGPDPGLQPYTYNPAMARSLLEQAGYADGFAITLNYRDVYRDYLPDPAGTAAAVAADLQAIGIDVTVEELATGDFLDKWHKGELDFFFLGWGIDSPHPLHLYSPILCVPALGPRDDELCDTLDAAWQATSAAEERALVSQASRLARDGVHVLPIGHGRYPLVLERDLMGTSFYWFGGVDFAEAHYASDFAFLPLTVRD